MHRPAACLLLSLLCYYKFFSSSFLQSCHNFVPEQYNRTYTQSKSHTAQLKRIVFRFISLVSALSIHRQLNGFRHRVTHDFTYSVFFFILCVPLYVFVYVRSLNVISTMIVLLSLQMILFLFWPQFSLAVYIVVVIIRKYFNLCVLKKILVNKQTGR